MRSNSRIAYAEKEGFEPSVAYATHGFQPCSFGLSDTSPGWRAYACALSALHSGERGIRTLGEQSPQRFSRPSPSASSGISPFNHESPAPGPLRRSAGHINYVVCLIASSICKVFFRSPPPRRRYAFQRPTRVRMASIAGSGLIEGAETKAGSCR